MHLARIVRRSIRPTDIISRYGGEEFVILLPETQVKDAVSVMARVQRELTKRIFLHNNERLLVTFSAGVAEASPGENAAMVLQRADEALYVAKERGKNRVMVQPAGQASTSMADGTLAAVHVVANHAVD